MSKSDKICKDGASKSNDDDVCKMNDMLHDMSTADDVEDNMSVCANCGKTGGDINNMCNKCKQVKYCNAICKKVHKKKHKKHCEEHCRLAAEKHNEELRIAAELHDIELFKQPPPAGDCPICFERLPTLDEGRRYKTCCGKIICSGCSYAPVYDDKGNKVDNKCAFCRTPTPKSIDEANEREKKRMEKDDPMAIYNLGVYYAERLNGLPQDHTKALELWHRAAKLGHAKAYCNIGYAYNNGRGVEVDKKKANYYYELGAMGGDSSARNNLGCHEEEAGNMVRALKHWMVAVGSGHSGSLKSIQNMYSYGYAPKEVYTKALQSYQAYLGEIKSKQRDEAAAADDKYRYY